LLKKKNGGLAEKQKPCPFLCLAFLFWKKKGDGAAKEKEFGCDGAAPKKTV